MQPFRTLAILLLAFISITACQKEEQSSRSTGLRGCATLEILAEEWLDALATGDFEEARHCFVQPEDLDAREAIMRVTGCSDEDIELAIGLLGSEIDQYPQSFARCVAAGKADAIDWDKAVITEIVPYEITNAGAFQKIAGLQYAFTVDGKLRAFLLDDCIRLERGWVMMNQPYLYRERE
jgi:hypothetical protein